MKKLMIVLAAALLVAGCSTVYHDSMGNVVSKETYNRLTQEAIEGHLADRRYRVIVDRMYPRLGPSIYLNYDYGMEVSNDSVGLFLPYFGRLYSVPYGKNGGLFFISPIQSYEEKAIKDGKSIIITTRNEGEVYKIVLDQFNNASSQLMVSASNRDAIRFSGNMAVNDNFVPLDSLRTE